MVAVIRYSEAAIWQTANPELGPGKWLARRINPKETALLTNGITLEIHWVPGHCAILRSEEADHQVNIAWESIGSERVEWPYTSASNRARYISKGRSAANLTQWEADKCSKCFGYSLKSKAGNRRPIPTTSTTSLATRLYQLQCGHAPTGACLTWFGLQEEGKCLWCRRTVTHTWDYLLRQCSRWKYRQRELWMIIRKKTGWKTDRFRWVRVLDVFSMVRSAKAVMDLVAAEEMNGYLVVRNHPNCVDLWLLCKSVWDQMLERIEYVFWCMVRYCLSTLGSFRYIYSP